MTLTDPTTEWHSTSQQSPPTAFPRRGVVLHHGATTSADLIIQMETSGSRQVSSDRVIKDNRNAKIVDPWMRAWSLSSAHWDSVLRSIECANESLAGYTISNESAVMCARQTAFWAQEEKWWPHRDGDPRTWTVYGHREIYTIFGDSYPTACPGGMPIDDIVKLAQKLLKGTEPVENPIYEEEEMAIQDGGYIAEMSPDGKTFIRGALFGPGVEGGVMIAEAKDGIETLQAMGNIGGYRGYVDADGTLKRVGAPLKYVQAKEFVATVALARSIFADKE